MRMPRSPSARRWLAFVLPGIAAVVLYAPTLTFDRTFDDLRIVPEPGTRPPGGWARVWDGPYWETTGEGGLYRPLTSATYLLESEAGLPLAARHGFNVLLHAGVTLLVVRLALSLGLAPGVAGIVGILFAVHPVHVEAVAGLVGRAELLSALCLLLALWFHDRAGGERTPGWGTLLPAAALAFAAAGAKESAWPLLLFAAVLHLARGRPFRPALPLWAGYALGLAGHLVQRHRVLGGWLNTPEFTITSFDNPLVDLHGWSRFLGGLRMAGMNLGHLVFPVRLSPDYTGGAVDPTGGPADPRLWGGVVLIVACAAGTVWGARRRSRPWAAACLVGSGWLLISAVLVMNVGLTLGTIFADRLLYWPSVAWLLVLGGFVAAGSRAPVPDRVPRGIPWRKTVVPLLLLGLAAAYAVRASAYLPAWKNGETLFQEAVQAYPGSPRAWYNLGQTLQDQGRFAEAADAFRKVETLIPDFQLAWVMNAVVLMRMEKWEEAKAPLAEALRLKPDDVLALLNEGVLWMETGDLPRAEARFRQILAREPDRLDALWNLALVEARSGRPGDAAATWRRYLGKDPDSPTALNNLAWILSTELDDPEEGIRLARRAVALAPGDANVHDTLAEALRRTGRIDEAITEIREALRLEPGDKYRKRLEEISSAGSR
jgi:protein O-mannosyl-transferase